MSLDPLDAINLSFDAIEHTKPAKLLVRGVQVPPRAQLPVNPPGLRAACPNTRGRPGITQPGLRKLLTYPPQPSAGNVTGLRSGNQSPGVDDPGTHPSTGITGSHRPHCGEVETRTTGRHTAAAEDRRPGRRRARDGAATVPGRVWRRSRATARWCVRVPLRRASRGRAVRRRPRSHFLRSGRPAGSPGVPSDPDAGG